MTSPGLPPELQDLLERLQRRGLAISPLELVRLRHLLGVESAVCSTDIEADCPTDLEVLLTAVLCKDARQRTLLQREYRRWQSDYEGAAESSAARSADDLSTGKPDTLSELDAGRLGLGAAGQGMPGRGRWRCDWRSLWRDRRQAALSGAALVLAVGIWIVFSPPPPPPPPPPTFSGEQAKSTPTGPICPQDLPTEAVAKVWAWTPRPDYRPWLTLGGGLVLLLLTLGAAWRLRRADHRYLKAHGASKVGDRAPRRGLPPISVHGDLLLDPTARREMVWSIDRYVSEDPSRELDAEATVTATARAGGEPRIIHRRLSFPRQVWLWCDQKTARPALQACLIAEVRKALDQANLPVRVARFHGLPTRLVWDDNREPFTPAYSEAAGAEAAVAVVTDGKAMVQAWESPGERSLLERLLRELRAWPRLCLIDPGADAELPRLCSRWRLQARGAQDLAAWLAGRPAQPGGREPPDPAQLDLWAAAWLLGGAAEDHAAAQILRQIMGLHLQPLDYPHLQDRFADCSREPELADRLVNRLAHSQVLDEQRLPHGDGYFSRALDFWERRLEDGIDRLPDDDAESRARLTIDLARLRLWRDPKRAAAELIRLDRGRNRRVIRGPIRGLTPPAVPESAPAATGRGAIGGWQQLPRKVQYRLLQLGLAGSGAGNLKLRLGVRHHLALALLAGLSLGGLGWGTLRFWDPHLAGDAVYEAPLFQAQVIEAVQGERVWLGSPWFLTALPVLGPLETPFTWSWGPVGFDNPRRLGPEAGIFVSGSQAFPIRGCDAGWPRRSLAVIAASLTITETNTEPAAWTDAELAVRRLAIRLLDRGTADRVLVALDWEQRLGELTQGVRLADDQLLVFLPPDVPAPPDGVAADFARAAEVRGEPAALAAALDFHWPRPVDEAWPEAATRVFAGTPSVRGGPEVWTDAKTGVTWVRVCGGTFSMGSPESEDEHVEQYAKDYAEAFGGTPEERKEDVSRWLSRERPRHSMLVDDFWIIRTELTRGQYQALGRDADGEPSLPQVGIDWTEANAACRDLPPPLGTTEDGWVSKPSLASEAQWEYAARAGTATRWSFGDDPKTLGEYAWFRGNAEDATNKPVAEKNPNGLCLADMHGNVFEWVDDCFAESAYRNRADTVGLDRPGASVDCERRVVRGGSFGFPPVFLRSANRDDDRPDDRNENLGLRCVRSRARQP